MKFDIITLFPEMFSSYFEQSIIGRAIKEKKIKIDLINLRDFSSDKHKTVDDKPYGGGVGMLMKIEPIYKCLKKIKALKNKKTKVILLSAKGKKFDQSMAKKFTKYDKIVMLCGRYEGVDERVSEFIDEQISLGDYVLTGGELGSMIIVDAVSRLLPGVLGKDESSTDESHSEQGILEYPQYTRPAEFVYKEKNKTKSLKVPEILLSGDHKKISEWRKMMRKKIM
jgi:tRNA (guanine37-N1)-methyltransferase